MKKNKKLQWKVKGFKGDSGSRMEKGVIFYGTEIENRERILKANCVAWILLYT